MTFLSSLRRALGFSGDDIEDDDDDFAAVSVSPAVENTDSCAETDTAAVQAEPAKELEFDPEVRNHILDGVLAVFNSALPDFLQRSIDPESQRKTLADSLDASVAEYMNRLRAEAEAHAESRLRNASEASRAESERLRREMEKLEQQKTSIREQQLSADRRRRALSERVNDLESQLAKVEAEREQFELENRSLLNKVKLADVQPGIIEGLQQEIERLRGGAPAADPAETEALRAEAETLRAEADTLRSSAESLTAELEAAHSTATELEERATSLGTELAAKDDEVNALNARVADLTQAQELSKQIYTELQEELTGEREARKKAEDDLAESMKIMETVRELESQIGQVQTVIAKRDERIARLKANNKSLKEELNRANERLRRRDDGEGNLFSQADADILSAEDDFECPDWFVSVPGPDTPPLRASGSDFGYTEPPRKPQPPENDAQLSLF